MRRSAIDLGDLLTNGRARLRIPARDHRATETRLRRSAAAISESYARLRVASVEDGDGYLDVDVLLDEIE